MNKFYITFLFLALFLYGCHYNITSQKNINSRMVDLGENKTSVDQKLGEAKIYEKNEDGSFTATYYLDNRKYFILYNNNLQVTHFIVD